MRVRYTPRALRQFDKILADLIRVNPAASKSLRQRAQAMQISIGQFPDSFQKIDERKGVRRAPLTPYPYIVFYRVLKDDVEIVSVRHGARDKPWEDL